MESTSSVNLSNFVSFVGENNDLNLKRLVQGLSTECRKESPNFSLYVDEFHKLMEAEVDPPYEVIWAYAALNFRSRNFAKEDALDRISAAKDLFQLLSACSSSSGASKSIALLATVVSEVYKVILELFGKKISAKRERKATGELRSLVDIVLGYFSISCIKNPDEEHDSSSLNLIMPLKDLVTVWINADEKFESLLPLVSGNIFHWLCTRESIVAYLAGAVIMEAFLLKLYLSCQQEKPRDELEKNLKSWAVGSISSFQNINFFDLRKSNPTKKTLNLLGGGASRGITPVQIYMCVEWLSPLVKALAFHIKSLPQNILVRTMLETPFPLSAILKPEDELLLKQVLFDAILLVDYSFLYLYPKHLKSVTMTILIVTHKAINYFSSRGDHSRAISYTKAFSASRLPSQIIKWVTSNLNGLDEKESRSYRSSPRVFMKWLLSLEDKGIRVFGDEILRSQAKLGLDVSEAQKPAANLEGKTVDDELFYVDNMGEENKQDESISAAFIAAADTMFTDSGSEKRKGTSTEKKRKRIKFVKYDLRQSLETRKSWTSVTHDSSSDESEVGDPASDADTEATE